MVFKATLLFFIWCCMFSFTNLQLIATDFTHSELKLLDGLKHSFCASSRNWNNQRMIEPWFCVPRKRCTSDLGFLQDYIFSKVDNCNRYSHSGTDPFCCHIGYIKGMEPGFEKKYMVRSNQINFYAEFRRIGSEFIDVYIRRLYNSRVSSSVRAVFKDRYICALVPLDYRSNLVQYLPLVCTEEDECNRIKNNFLIPSQVRRIISEGRSNRFCEKTSPPTGRVCCHPAAIDTEDTDSLNKNWKAPVLLPDQKFAYGFQSSFQCQQFARQVCDGTTDSCIRRRDFYPTTLPGEFPYLALIGITHPRTQYFYCSGTIVSKYLILSSALCMEHDEKRAGVTLTGDFDLWSYRERGSSETLSDIIHVIKSPDSEREELILALFVLRVPLVFGPYLRPACAHRSVFISASLFSQLGGTFSGFGTLTTGGRWSQYPKKVSLINLHQGDEGCLDYDKNSGTFCYPRTENDIGRGPCEFDLGAAIVYQDTLYCQWKIFGVAITQEVNCTKIDHETFIVYLKVGLDSLSNWLEKNLFTEDFNLYEFDVSWPKCDYKERYFLPDYIPHLSKSYADIYPDNFSIPYEN